MIFSIILDPHSIIKQAGMMEHATSNAAELLSGTSIINRCVNAVFTAKVTGQNG